MAESAPSNHRSLIPEGLRQDWPVPWQPVWGERDGFFAQAESALALGVVRGLSRLPEALREPLMGGLARAMRALDRRHRRSALLFLRQALASGAPFPGERQRVLQAYRHFLRILVEGAMVDRLRMGSELLESCEVEFCADALRARDEGRGAILVTAHLGDWEAASAFLPRLGYDPFYAFARPPKNRPMSKVLQEARERRGIRVLPRRGGMLDARKVIAAGGCLGLVLDQRARKKPVLAPFFGRPARCDRSAGVLLRRLQVPVLIFACLREGPLRRRMVCRSVFWPEELAGVGPRELATRINRELEALILEHPDQYFWLHDRYRDTPLELPPEEPS